MNDHKKTKAQLIRELVELRNDLTSLDKMTAECQFDEDIFRSLESSSRAGCYVIQEGKFVFVNHYASKYWGYKPGSISLNFIHPDDRQRVRENAIKMLQGKRSSSYEFRALTKDGEIKWFTESVTPILFKGERAVLGISMEITEMIAARNKLMELEALEASILDAFPHAVIGLKRRLVVFANDGVQLVFGWKPKDLIGQNTRILYPTDQMYEEIANVLYSTLERQRTFKTDFTCRRKDGTDIECMISASRIGDSLKEKHIVVTFEDITDRKRAELELAASREQLRQLSAHLESVREKERTHIARELHDELGQLLTALNTDIVLLSKQLPKDQKSWLEKTESMAKLVDMLLNAVKRIYMDLRPSMLDHLGVAAAIGWQADEFQKRTGIACKVEIQPEDMELNSEISTAIFRIFQETLTNVVRHADASEVAVSLKVAGSKLRLSVRDNGKGFTGEQMSKPNSFGLLGIQERTYHLGGKIDISGKVGKGTVVKVTIPLKSKRKAHEKD